MVAKRGGGHVGGVGLTVGRSKREEIYIYIQMGFPSGTGGKEPAAEAGDT